MIPINYEKVNCYSKTEEILKAESKKLLTLIGKSISDIWVVWELDSNKWDKDSPIIIDVEGIQLLLNHHETSNVDIGWNSVQISNKKYNIDYGYNFQLQWTKDFELTKKYRNAIVKDIFVEEYKYKQKIIRSESNPELAGRVFEYWDFSGIGFSTNLGYISIFNGLDENALGFEMKQDIENYRYTSLVI